MRCSSKRRCPEPLSLYFFVTLGTDTADTPAPVLETITNLPKDNLAQVATKITSTSGVQPAVHSGPGVAGLDDQVTMIQNAHEYAAAHQAFLIVDPPPPGKAVSPPFASSDSTINDQVNGQLNVLGMNAIVRFRSTGPWCGEAGRWRAVTWPTAFWKYVPVRRLIDLIQ